jgi:hypothetical protein
MFQLHRRPSQQAIIYAPRELRELPFVFHPLLEKQYQFPLAIHLQLILRVEHVYLLHNYQMQQDRLQQRLQLDLSFQMHPAIKLSLRQFLLIQ